MLKQQKVILGIGMGVPVFVIVALVVLPLLMVGCAKKATAPVPGTIDSFDAFAARSIGDAQEALLSSKTWELCSDQNFPPAVEVESGKTRVCDNSSGPFPKAGRPILFKAEKSYNVALDAAKSYHAGATNDTVALTQALTQLGIDIGSLLAGIGKGH